MLRRSLKWLLVLLLALPVLALLWLAVFGWNWARGPLQDFALERSGRVLVIGGDLDVRLRWPAPRIRAKAVTFANPPWAAEAQMVSADEVEFTVDLLDLFRKRLVFPEVHLIRPVVFLELAADGRKTWLLDNVQLDESARIPIGRLTLDRGQLGYDDAKQKTRLRAELSTPQTPAGGADRGVAFSAKGLYKGLDLVAHGSGGAVMALHDESKPYPLSVDAKIGRTGIKASGTVTSLLKFSAIDMNTSIACRREIGCSMNRMESFSRRNAGVSRMRASSSATPAASAYCSLPSSDAKYGCGKRSSTEAIAVSRSMSACSLPPTLSLK